MAGQMHLAILADDSSVPIDQNRGVEMMAIGRELGITERETDTIVRGLLEERARRRIRHLAFEPGVDFRRLRHVPAWKKRRQRKLRIDYEVAVLSLGLLEQIDHSPHNRLPAVSLVDGAHLGGTNPKYSAHVVLLRTQRSAAPAG